MYMYIVCHVHEFTHNLVSMEVPVLWVRVDTEFQWIRQLVMEQSDTVWLDLSPQVQARRQCPAGYLGGAGVISDQPDERRLT